MDDRVHRIIGLIIFLMFSVISLSFSQSNDQITITTYYPSPSGQYNELRFFPHNAPTVPCDAAHKGYVFYNSTPGVDSLSVCRYNPASSSYEWAPGGGGGYWEANGNDIHNTNLGKVGIGTTTPAAKLTIQDGAILASGTWGQLTGGTPVSGDGIRLMWIPAKSAFRAGTTVGGNWDDANIGPFSIAMGNNPIAGGLDSVAIGSLVNAGGDDSVAIGSVSSASGRYSVVLGVANKATGLESIVLGNNSRATADGAHAIGNSVIASGLGSFAMGSYMAAAGRNSFGISLDSGSGVNEPSRTVFQDNTMAIIGGKVGIGTTSPFARLQISPEIPNITYRPLYVRNNGSEAANIHPAAFVNTSDIGVVVGAENPDTFGSIDAGNFVNGELITPHPLVLNRAGGNVGIGTTNPQRTLEVKGNVLFSGPDEGLNTISIPNSDIDVGGGPDGIFGIRHITQGANWITFSHADSPPYGSRPTAMVIDTWNARVGIGGDFVPQHTLHVFGGAYCDGVNWVNGSDRAYKKNISDSKYGLKEVLKLRPREFDMKQDGSHQIGFVAQEIEKVIPEVVSGKEGQKGVSYGNLTAVLINAIKEQQAQIDNLQSEVRDLKSKLNAEK